MTRDIDHRNAVRALIDDPESVAKARTVLTLALGEPERAAIARETFAPQPQQGLALDLLREEYRRHNLRIPDRPKQVTSPDHLPELIEVMTAAVSATQPLKAIGDGYGFANTGFTRGTLIALVNDLFDILPVEAGVLRVPADADRLLQFECGATIEQLNFHLSQHGRALLNQPGFEKLTYAGTMTSGGHGSGIWTGPLSSHVVSIHMLVVDQERAIKQLRIEPSNGITDPDKFKAAHPEITLLQQDDIFHACTCSMGCLGVMYALTILTRKAYNILENRTKLRWLDLRQRLPGLLAEQGPNKRLHSIEIWINPYPIAGEVYCVLGERQETTDPPRGRRGLAIEFGGSELLFRVLSWWMHHHPSTIPSLIDAALSATTALDVVLPSPQGLNFGGPNNAPVVASAIGVPVQDIGKTIDSLIAFLQQRRDRSGANITSPIGLRFVKAAKAFMSPAHERDTCMIELPILEGTPKARETLTAFLDFMCTNHQGRPHWGQYNPIPGELIAKAYPRLADFLTSYRVLNSKGFLDNAFTEQMGFRLRQ